MNEEIVCRYDVFWITDIIFFALGFVSAIVLVVIYAIVKHKKEK